VVGAFALTAAAAIVSAGTAVSASAASSTTHASKALTAFAPGFLHATRATSQPPTTADCETVFQVACYEPGQIQTAYNLKPLYQRGVTGRGQTIVIVDSFGSPTIQNDLKVFDQTFGLPAPP
jgi:subtilase family serine protease